MKLAAAKVLATPDQLPPLHRPKGIHPGSSPGRARSSDAKVLTTPKWSSPPSYQTPTENNTTKEN